MAAQHSKRHEVSRHTTYSDASFAFARRKEQMAAGQAPELPMQIRKHPGYYALVERVPLKKEAEAA